MYFMITLNLVNRLMKLVFNLINANGWFMTQKNLYLLVALLLTSSVRLTASQSIAISEYVVAQTFCKDATFSKVKAGLMFGGGQLPSIIPDSEYNKMFKDPIENTHKTLVDALLQKTNDLNLEVVTDHFIKSQCDICSKNLGDIVEKNETCFKTPSNTFIHKSCVTRGEMSQVVEVKPILQSLTNFYDALKVPVTASKNEIFKSYDSLKKINENNKEMSFLLQEAFNILSDDNLRSQYNVILGIDKSKTLSISLNQAQECGIIQQFRTLVDSIAFLYKNRKGFIASRFKLDEKITYLENNANVLGFGSFFEKVITPASKEKDIAKAIVEYSETLTFKEKLQFLCSWIAGTMEFSQSEEPIKLALNDLIVKQD